MRYACVTFCADLWPKTRPNWNRKDCGLEQIKSKQIVNKSEIIFISHTKILDYIYHYIYHIYIFIYMCAISWAEFQFHLAICTWQYERIGAGVWCGIYLHWTLESDRILRGTADLSIPRPGCGPGEENGGCLRLFCGPTWVGHFCGRS